MKSKIALVGLVLALSIMATTVVNATTLNIRREGKYSIWSYQLNSGSLDEVDKVVFEYMYSDNKLGLIPGIMEFELTNYVDNSDLGTIVLVFELNDLNNIIHDLEDSAPDNYKIYITATRIEFTKEGDPDTYIASGPAWRRRGGYI